VARVVFIVLVFVCLFMSTSTTTDQQKQDFVVNRREDG